MKPSLAIAFDFDGTLFENRYPNIGEPKEHLINLAIQLQERGHSIILWTCREGKSLKQAVEVCEKHGLKFDYINCNDKVDFGYPKIFYNYLIDDRAVGYGYFEHLLFTKGVDATASMIEKGEL